MDKIRYFGRLVDPADYKRGFGVYSLCIRAVDWLRYRLERTAAILILRCELKRIGATKAEVADAVERAKADSRFDPAAHHEAALMAAPLYFDRSSFKSLMADRGARYQDPRIGDSTPERPVAFDEGAKVTFSFYQQRFDRAARYVASPSDYQLQEEFEPVGDDDGQPKH